MKRWFTLLIMKEMRIKITLRKGFLHKVAYLDVDQTSYQEQLETLDR